MKKVCPIALVINFTKFNNRIRCNPARIVLAALGAGFILEVIDLPAVLV
jgi:hypothetical protein